MTMVKTKHHISRALKGKLPIVQVGIVCFVFGTFIGMGHAKPVTEQDVIDFLSVKICDIQNCQPKPLRKPVR